MTRWADDPERAADELITRSLDAIDWQGRILLANQAGSLPSRLAARGLSVHLWNRRLMTDGKAEPWPASGNFDIALLRLPKAKGEQEMSAHACLSMLPPSGRLIVYGGNDEGIRSAAVMLDRLCGGIETLATRGHGRVLSARRPSQSFALRPTLAQWRSVLSLEVGGASRDWVSYPGVFAAARIDDGTALLTGALPPLHPGARVLDYGCGSGVIGAAALAQEPTITLDLTDNDSVALEAARENVPTGRRLLARDLADSGKARYGAILSNPPLHKEFVEDHSLLQRLISDAPAHLVPEGVLQIVVQRRIPLEKMLTAKFGAVSIVAENSRYRVWRATGLLKA